MKTVIPKPDALGPIRPDELYPWPVLKRRLGLCQRGGRELVRAGLRQIIFGKRRYVLGKDAMALFARLAMDNGEQEK